MMGSGAAHMCREVLRKKLAQQKRKTAFLETSKAQVVNELEELTQTLFEESNKLVRDEAVQRWQSQQANLKLGTPLTHMRPTRTAMLFNVSVNRGGILSHG